jgi:hypothetical protein
VTKLQGPTDVLKLGSFLYVKNARAIPGAVTTDNPKYWVGRVAEIIRGGRVRLHWHRETSLQSGVYVPTNHFFADAAENLKPFHSYSFDKASKGFILTPRVESEEFEDPDADKKGVVCVAEFGLRSSLRSHVFVCVYCCGGLVLSG